MVKGEQNHRKTIDANGSRGKKIVSHRSQKMTIVHLYIWLTHWHWQFEIKIFFAKSETQFKRYCYHLPQTSYANEENLKHDKCYCLHLPQTSYANEECWCWQIICPRRSYYSTSHSREIYNKDRFLFSFVEKSPFSGVGFHKERFWMC